MQSYNSIHKACFDELSKAIFYFRHPHFYTHVQDFFTQSKRAYDELELENNVENQPNIIAGKEHLLNNIERFAHELTPYKKINFSHVSEWSSLVFYASIVLAKVFFLDRIKLCADYLGLPAEQVLNINYNLAKTFVNCDSFTIICSEKCPKYFLGKLLEIQDLEFLEILCKKFLSYEIHDNLSHFLLEQVVNNIKLKLDKVDKK